MLWQRVFVFCFGLKMTTTCVDGGPCESYCLCRIEVVLVETQKQSKKKRWWQKSKQTKKETKGQTREETKEERQRETKKEEWQNENKNKQWQNRNEIWQTERQTERQGQPRNEKCALCYETDSSDLLLAVPCGHRALCQPCVLQGIQLRLCPTCSQPVWHWASWASF